MKGRSEQSVPIAVRTFASNLSPKVKTLPALRWGTSASFKMIPDKAAGNPTPETFSVRRKERVTENEVGNRFNGASHSSPRSIQLRLVPRQNLVETRTVFCNPLLVELTYFDFLVPQHPFKIIEHRQ